MKSMGASRVIWFHGSGSVRQPAVSLINRRIGTAERQTAEFGGPPFPLKSL
jgi:hypothetical protein